MVVEPDMVWFRCGVATKCLREVGYMNAQPTAVIASMEHNSAAYS